MRIGRLDHGPLQEGRIGDRTGWRGNRRRKACPGGRPAAGLPGLEIDECLAMPEKGALRFFFSHGRAPESWPDGECLPLGGGKSFCAILGADGWAFQDACPPDGGDGEDVRLPEVAGRRIAAATDAWRLRRTGGCAEALRREFASSLGQGYRQAFPDREGR